MLQICQSKQLSFQQRQHPTIWWLIIDSPRLCCLSHTFSLSVCLRVSPFPHSLSFPRLDTGSNMKAADLCLGLSQVILLLVPCSTPPKHTHTHSLCCYGTCQVATGTLISPLIRPLNPSVDSIQPSFMSEKSRSKTPCCLTLQKLTRVPLPSLCHLLQLYTLFFFYESKRNIFKRRKKNIFDTSEKTFWY